LGELERETGLEPATFSLEGLDLLAVWRASWRSVHFVSSYRVVVWLASAHFHNDSATRFSLRFLSTCNPDDFAGIDSLVVIAVTHPDRAPAAG